MDFASGRLYHVRAANKRRYVSREDVQAMLDGLRLALDAQPCKPAGGVGCGHRWDRHTRDGCRDCGCEGFREP